MSIWDAAGIVAKDIIEVGSLKIDNDTVEKIVGIGAVAVGAYAVYKVLNDKGAAENVSTVVSSVLPSYSNQSDDPFGLKNRPQSQVSQLIMDSLENPPPSTPESERLRDEVIASWEQAKKSASLNTTNRAPPSCGAF